MFRLNSRQLPSLLHEIENNVLNLDAPIYVLLLLKKLEVEEW